MARTATALSGSRRYASDWKSSPDWLHRCWQAEWEGCDSAVRAYTRLGCIRKAVRAQNVTERQADDI